jgi:hypothetical protein
VHRPAFTVTLVAEPGVDAIRSLRALLKIAGRRLGLRAIDVRQCALDAHQDERARTQPGSTHMSAFSDRIRSQRKAKGFFKIADFEGGKELTFTISGLDEEVQMFGKTFDTLNFQETGQQLQLNQTTSEWLLDNLGDDPANYTDKKVTLYLAPYEYEGKTQMGVRLKKPGALASGDGAVVLPPRKDKSGVPEFDDDIPY